MGIQGVVSSRPKLVPDSGKSGTASEVTPRFSELIVSGKHQMSDLEAAGLAFDVRKD
jgi:hypothetical protein